MLRVHRRRRTSLWWQLGLKHGVVNIVASRRMVVCPMHGSDVCVSDVEGHVYESDVRVLRFPKWPCSKAIEPVPSGTSSVAAGPGNGVAVVGWLFVRCIGLMFVNLMLKDICMSLMCEFWVFRNVLVPKPLSPRGPSRPHKRRAMLRVLRRRRTRPSPALARLRWQLGLKHGVANIVASRRMIVFSDAWVWCA
jgi:hypothetical protein